jgi:hypothetical protein
MAFDFHLHIPETSRSGQVIQMLAEERHITPEQAAERLLEEAAQLHTPAKTHQVKVSPEYLRQLKTRSAARAEARRANGDPMAASRPETPDALIGYLADAPEVAQTIRDMAYERRASSYGI